MRANGILSMEMNQQHFPSSCSLTSSSLVSPEDESPLLEPDSVP